MQDQEAMLRLIREKIVQVEANALGKERGPSTELYWVYQHGDGMTASNCCMPEQVHAIQCSSVHSGYLTSMY